MKICTRAGGGLGNRILGSVTAYYFSTLFDEPLYINWPEGNPGCLATWNDLFEDTKEIICQNFEENDDTFYIVHNTEYFKDKKNVLSHREKPTKEKPVGEPRYDSKELLEQIIINKADNNILVQDDGAHISHIPMDIIIRFFSKGLKIKNNILTKAKKFCNNHNITSNTIGIHLRLTDMLHFGATPGENITDEDENNLRNAVLAKYADKIEEILSEDKSTQFFVCSDDPYAEVTLTKRFPKNVSSYGKKHYVEKFHEDKDWKRMDDTGEDICSFNVSRSSESVVEAMIDCLILSRTRSGYFPRVGSFNKLAKFFNIVEFD